ncbi:NAD-dependent epimerase/dehydratase family protein [Idiomarina aminovorans]|uniref:NAD-dependent epimerase/dehydratase family protein n=1 Tax=Idiomarina aminovorans TaxID=2914829 RepID=UPI0020065B46|nr:NAD-dependent epimerase/dehydratase family protein [Idiomarina sp. ATCH4]MCK7459141.1 NAD-dependent epimerase/dehydratase family protein [Idiomarina sp. ATCH4]
MKVLLTGSTGFLGAYLNKYFLEKGLSTVTPIRKAKSDNASKTYLHLSSLNDLTTQVLSSEKVDTFVHCAGVAHKHEISVGEFSRVNTDLTLLLAHRAAAVGVKRFVFFSSIGVNGASSESPFNARDKEAPYDAYTESKYDAEKGLREISLETGMEIVIIRPPLIYGSNAPGNFAKFVKLASIPVPKPLGSINNKRSFVSVENLSDFTYLCLTHTAAANETFLVSDGEDLSTTEFLRKMSNAMGKRAMLIPFPVSWMRRLASFVDKQKLINKLAVNVQVDIEKNRTLLGWEPKVSIDEALRNALSQEKP